MEARDRLLNATPWRGLQRRWRAWRRPEQIRVHGVKVPLDDRWLTPEIRRGLYEGWYERPEARAVRNTLRPSDRYLEVGAGIGVVTTVACQVIGSDRVTAFEANPQLIDVIRRTAAVNGCHPEVVNALLGRDDQPQDFFIQHEFWTSSVDPTTGGRPVIVPGRPFDAELQRVQPTYLMLDIEGAEIELLAGQLLPSAVRAVCMEVHPGVVGRAQVHKLVRHLEDQGFAVDFNVSGSSVAYLERLDEAGHIGVELAPPEDHRQLTEKR
jgi:FkbM family methyltransferase